MTVVVGVDGSDVGRHALEWAVEEARLRQDRLRVLHVWSPPAPMSAIGPVVAPVDPSEYEQWAKAVLAEDVARIAEDAGASDVQVVPELVRGYPPKVLLDAAHEAELLVVGNRGRGGFGDLLLGSVGQHCVTHASGPVAVVHETAPLPDASDVVVGVDGSEGSQIALEFALAEAAHRRARLIVAQAWWVAHPSSSADVLPFVSVSRSEHVAHSRELMQAMVRKATRADHAEVEIELQPLEDAPAPGLLALSEDAGLLVVGSRGRGGFAGLLLGSVSQQCVHHARCAVVVVPGR